MILTAQALIKHPFARVSSTCILPLTKEQVPVSGPRRAMVANIPSWGHGAAQLQDGRWDGCGDREVLGIRG